MKTIVSLLLIGFILVFWYLANIFSKPVLNKMKNFYEDDPTGRSIANIFIGLIIIASYILGLFMF